MEVESMTALFITIPLAMVIAFVALVIMLMSMKNGQFDDIEAPKYRILFDDDKPIVKKEKGNG
jgi:cbb3-type cytochrome oxidase maturation protein